MRKLPVRIHKTGCAVPQRLGLTREVGGQGSGGEPGRPPLHGQGLPQERREHRLPVVVSQQQDALDEALPHFRGVHHGQVGQDGTQDLSHLGGGRASPGPPGPHGPLALTLPHTPPPGTLAGCWGGSTASTAPADLLVFPEPYQVFGMGGSARRQRKPWALVHHPMTDLQPFNSAPSCSVWPGVWEASSARAAVLAGPSSLGIPGSPSRRWPSPIVLPCPPAP